MTAERHAEFLAEHKANFNAFKNEPRLIDVWIDLDYIPAAHSMIKSK